MFLSFSVLSQRLRQDSVCPMMMHRAVQVLWCCWNKWPPNPRALGSPFNSWLPWYFYHWSGFGLSLRQRDWRAAPLRYYWYPDGKRNWERDRQRCRTRGFWAEVVCITSHSLTFYWPKQVLESILVCPSFCGEVFNNKLNVTIENEMDDRAKLWGEPGLGREPVLPRHLGGRPRLIECHLTRCRWSPAPT